MSGTWCDVSTPDPIPNPTNAADRYGSRKFLQAVFVQLSGAALCWAGKLDGGTYVTLTAMALSIYGISSITDKKVNGAA